MRAPYIICATLSTVNVKALPHFSKECARSLRRILLRQQLTNSMPESTETMLMASQTRPRCEKYQAAPTRPRRPFFFLLHGRQKARQMHAGLRAVASKRPAHAFHGSDGELFLKKLKTFFCILLIYILHLYSYFCSYKFTIMT